MDESKIIIFKDLLDTKARKEKELAFYTQELKKLQEKMHYIQLEIKLTSDIIHMIEREKIVDINNYSKYNPGVEGNNV